jgi:hypothetical protein
MRLVVAEHINTMRETLCFRWSKCASSSVLREVVKSKCMWSFARHCDAAGVYLRLSRTILPPNQCRCALRILIFCRFSPAFQA